MNRTRMPALTLMDGEEAGPGVPGRIPDCEDMGVLSRDADLDYPFSRCHYREGHRAHHGTGQGGADLLHDFAEHVGDGGYDLAFCHVIPKPDLGMEQAKPWAAEQLTSLIDNRLRNAGRIVVSTNKTREELVDHVGARLTSRVFATNPDSSSDRIIYAIAWPIWAELVADLKAENRSGRRRQTFTISMPSSCSLKHEGDDLIIRRVLRQSGIEKSPAHGPGSRQAA